MEQPEQHGDDRERQDAEQVEDLDLDEREQEDVKGEGGITKYIDKSSPDI